MLYFRPRHTALNVPPGPLPPPLTAVDPICSRRCPCWGRCEAAVETHCACASQPGPLRAELCKPAVVRMRRLKAPARGSAGHAHGLRAAPLLAPRSVSADGSGSVSVCAHFRWVGARADSFCPGDSAAAALRKWRVSPRAWSTLRRTPALWGLTGPALPPWLRRRRRWLGRLGERVWALPASLREGEWGPGGGRHCSSFAGLVRALVASRCRSRVGALWPGRGARKRSVSSGRPWRDQRAGVPVRADRGELGRRGNRVSAWGAWLIFHLSLVMGVLLLGRQAALGSLSPRLVVVRQGDPACSLVAGGSKPRTCFYFKKFTIWSWRKNLLMKLLERRRGWICKALEKYHKWHIFCAGLCFEK